MRVRLGRAVRRRALIFLIAALSIGAVFVAGYVVRDPRGGSAPRSTVAMTLVLRGTSIAPQARAMLEVWPAREGNAPLTLSIVGLPKLPPRTYYEVDLVRKGEPWQSCGKFRTAGLRHDLTLTLNAPVAPRRGDSWIITRQTQGLEGGATVLRQI